MTVCVYVYIYTIVYTYSILIPPNNDHVFQPIIYHCLPPLNDDGIALQVRSREGQAFEVAIKAFVERLRRPKRPDVDPAFRGKCAAVVAVISVITV